MQRGKHFTLSIGEHIPWLTFYKSKRPVAWENWVKDKVYKLGGIDNVPI